MRRGREWRERRLPPAATNRSLKMGKECGMALHESYKWAIMWRGSHSGVLPPYNLHGRIDWILYPLEREDICILKF
jgi:hypothetical protein